MFPNTPNNVISYSSIYHRHILIAHNVYPILMHLLYVIYYLYHCHPERSAAKSKDLLNECKPYTLSLVDFEEILRYTQNDSTKHHYEF